MAAPQIEIVVVTPFQQNCQLLWDAGTRSGIVVDPGGDVPLILQRIAANRLSIEAILLTHGHLDHAGGAAELRRTLPALPDGTPVPVIGPDRRDAFLLSGIAAQATALGVPGMGDVEPDRYLRDGDVLELAGCRLEVRHVPGHTPGHVVFIDVAHARPGRRHPVPGFGRPHRLPLLRRPGADRRHQVQADGAGRRCRHHPRPWPALDDRRRAPRQPVPLAGPLHDARRAAPVRSTTMEDQTVRRHHPATALLAVSLALCGGGAARAQEAEPTAAQPTLKQVPLAIVGHDGVRHAFTVELAQTPRQQEVGLMFRTAIPPRAGCCSSGRCRSRARCG